MNDNQPIVGEIRMIQRGNEGFYHLWTGNKWATFDDPEIDNVFDLMKIEPSRRAAMREYYSSRTLSRHVDDKAVDDFTRVADGRRPDREENAAAVAG